MKTRLFEHKKIVLTGGPCGGKTSALPYISEKLRELDYNVIVVPEAATLCINAGVSPGRNFQTSVFQEAVMDMGFNMEQIFQNSLRKSEDAGKGTVTLCDRGIIDSLAYMPEREFRSLLRARGENLVSTRDTRYDAVIHMTSTAIGAESYYTCENNTARTETLAEAKELDRRTLDAWTDHHHIREVDNSTNFEGKLRRVFQEVCAVLGEPVPLEDERKFLVNVDLEKLKKVARPSEIEQTYLLTPNKKHELRVRKRGQNGEYFYTLTEKRDYGPGQRLEIERIISQSDYECFLRMRDPNKKTVRKTRYCFFYQSQYLEVDIYADQIMPNEAWNAVLEIELTNPDHKVLIPEWMRNVREVTNNSKFKNSTIARKLANT